VEALNGHDRRSLALWVVAWTALALASSQAETLARSAAEQDALIENLRLTFGAQRIRDGKLADDRETKLMADYQARLNDLQRQVTAARAERDKLQAAYNQLLAGIVDRASPGQAAQDSAAARSLVETATPDGIEQLKSYVANQMFTIYFPFDEYVLTPEALSAIERAAQEATSVVAKVHPKQVVVIGYSDTFPSVEYAMRLTERYAKATADALVAAGVPMELLEVDWKGKTDLAVPTPDGVREPLNRRATIELRF